MAASTLDVVKISCVGHIVCILEGGPSATEIQLLILWFVTDSYYVKRQFQLIVMT